MSTGKTSMVWALLVLLPVLASNLVDPALGVPAIAVVNGVNNQTVKVDFSAGFELYTYEGIVLKPSMEFFQDHLRDISSGEITRTSGDVSLRAIVNIEDFENSTEVKIRCHVHVPATKYDPAKNITTSFGYSFDSNSMMQSYRSQTDDFPYFKLRVGLSPRNR
jgi:hypothetical protein